MADIVVSVGDVHFGKQTSSFNVDVLSKRLNKFGDNLLSRLDLFSVNVDKMVFAMLGDIMDNDGIYPSQSHHVDDEAAYCREQVRKGVDLFRPFFTRFSNMWEVEVAGVRGNHGRVGKYTHEDNNWDMGFYDSLYWATESIDNLEVKPASKFYHTIETGGLTGLLYHGHGIRMYQRIPHYGVRDRIRNWESSLPEDFDYALFGHFHSYDLATWNGTPVFLNGTMVTGDDWALEALGSNGENIWRVLIIEDGVILAELPILLA